MAVRFPVIKAWNLPEGEGASCLRNFDIHLLILFISLFLKTEKKKCKILLFVCFCPYHLLMDFWKTFDLTTFVGRPNPSLVSSTPCTFILCLTSLTLEGTGVCDCGMSSLDLGYTKWLWSNKQCIKPQDQAGPHFAQVLQDVVGDFHPFGAQIPSEEVTHLIFLSFRKADVPWRTVGQDWIVYFLYFTSAKIYFQASREWEAEPEVQNEHDPLPSQPPPLCCS